MFFSILMCNKDRLIRLLIKFNHDELFYIFNTFLFFKGIEGFQTEEEGALLLNKKTGLDYTFIGDYRKKIEKYDIWERTPRYNPLTRRLSSYIVFKYKYDHLVEIISHYSQELELLLDQEPKDSNQYLLYRDRVKKINSFLTDLGSSL